MRHLLWSTRALLAAALFALALAAIGLLRAGVPRAAELFVGTTESTAAAAERHARSPADPLDTTVIERIAQAARSAPFAPTRQPPEGRYGEDDLANDDGNDSGGALGLRLRVLGVAHLGGGDGIAALEVEGQPPRVLRVGESIAGRTLTAVTLDGARLSGEAGAIELKVAREGGNP